MKKKLYAMVLFVAMLMTIGSASVFANNHSNSTFSFTFPQQESPTHYTSGRPKYDNSSAWMELTSLDNSSGAYYGTVVKSSNHSNFSKVWTYRFGSAELNSGVYMYNYAYEDYGYDVFVAIKATRACSPSTGFNASGDWSPDSV